MASQALAGGESGGRGTSLGDVFTTEHGLFRETVRRFIAREIDPHYLDWEKRENGHPRELWLKAAEGG